MIQYADVIYVTKTNDMSDEVIEQRLNKVKIKLKDFEVTKKIVALSRITERLKDYELSRQILIHHIIEYTDPKELIKSFLYRFEDTKDDCQKIVVFDADEFNVKELDKIRKFMPKDITLLTC